MLIDQLSTRKLEIWLVDHLVGSYYPAIIPNYYLGSWECDVFSLNRAGYTAEYEVKRSKTDYYKDFEKASYHRNHKKHDFIKSGKRTNRFWFILPENMDVEVPSYAGRINYKKASGSDWYGFNIVKKAPLLHKDKATEAQRFQMLMRLSMKHYELAMRISKNYDKYQLNL